jgi:uncharacterized protein with beta-barrel porin domain
LCWICAFFRDDGEEQGEVTIPSGAAGAAENTGEGTRMSWGRLRSFIVGCSILNLGASAWAAYPTDPRYDQGYIDAVDYCKAELTENDIDYHLTTITSSVPVLMTCFTDWDGYTRGYTDNSYRPQLWCTVAGEQWQFYKTHQTAPETLLLRTKKLLGLPSNNGGNWIVEFWVDPTSLFRPAVDESLTNPVTNIDEESANAWYKARKADIYRDAKNPPYPWTRAGYTYDWGTGTSDHVGLSEFVARTIAEVGGIVITVRSVFSPVSYLYYVRETDSFNVTDWCDTIWIGTKYLPATAGGNQIDIASNVMMYGGEGILVTDLSGQDSNVVINNHGIILGPGSTLRGSSVSFVNAGGTLNNTGTITGDRYGVLGDNTSARPITINNTGTITGTIGAIQTGGGDDTINLLGGSIFGSIDGGAGTNTLNFNLPAGTTFAFSDDILNIDNVNVNSGTARLQGAVSGKVTVAASAVLGGNCTLSGNLDNSGNVAPGNSIGTIHVGGNYTQNAGGRLTIEVAKPSSGSLAGDQLIVGGTATLAAGSQIDVRFGSDNGRVFSNGDAFHVITAAGLDDRGAVVNFDSMFLDFSGSAGANDYTITIHRTATFASAATPGNNARLAAALDADAATASDGYAELINQQLLFTNASAFNGSLQQLSPAAYLTVSAASDRTTQYMAEAWGGYLRMRRAGRTNMVPSQASSYRGSEAFARAIDSPAELAGTIKYCANERTTIRELQDVDRSRSVWVNPFGVFFGERSSGDHLGFQSNVAGVQFGIDKQYDENFIFGIGGGYDQLHVDTADLYSAGEAETFRIGPYLTWFNDEWYCDASFTGGFHGNSVGRQVNVGGDEYVAHGNYRANDLSLYVGGGRDIQVADSTLSPLVSLQWIGYRQNEFTESNADGANLEVDPLDAHSLRSRVGGQWMRVYRWHQVKIVPEVFGGWAHEYLANDNLEARFLGGATRFSTDRGGIFRDSGYYGVTLTAIPREHSSFFARYNGEYSSGGHFAAVDLGVVYEF